MKLTHTLSLVRDKVLKSVITNQSLYVCKIKKKVYYNKFF